MILAFKNELKLYGKGRDLADYIKKVHEFTGGDYFRLPDYLSLDDSHNRLTALSLIITCDIWTIRLSGFLSQLSRKLTINSIFCLKSMYKWVELSNYIPVNIKLKKLLSKFYNDLSCIIVDLKNMDNSDMSIEDMNKCINNDIFYYFDEIQDVLKKRKIRSWEDGNIALVTKQMSDLDMSEIFSAIKECPVEINAFAGNNNDALDNFHAEREVVTSIRKLLNNSRLLKFVRKVKRRVCEFKDESWRFMNGGIIDVEKLVYLLSRIERLPRNAVLFKGKFKKMLNYSRMIEKRVDKELVLLFGNFSDIELKERRDNESFCCYSSRLFGLLDHLTIIDWIISSESFLEYYDHDLEETREEEGLECGESEEIRIERERAKERGVEDGKEENDDSTVEEVASSNLPLPIYLHSSKRNLEFQHQKKLSSSLSPFTCSEELTLSICYIEDKYRYYSNLSRRLKSQKIRLLLVNLRKIQNWISNVKNLYTNYLECIEQDSKSKIKKHLSGKIGFKEKYVLFMSYFTDSKNNKREKYFNEIEKMNECYSRNKSIFLSYSQVIVATNIFLDLRAEYENLEKFTARIRSSNLSFSSVLFFVDCVLQGILFKLLPNKSSIFIIFRKLRIYSYMVNCLETNIKQKESQLSVMAVRLLALYVNFKETKKEAFCSCRQKCEPITSYENVNSQTDSECVCTYSNLLTRQVNEKLNELHKAFVFQYNSIVDIYSVIESNVGSDVNSLKLMPDNEFKLREVINYLLSKSGPVYDGICRFILDLDNSATSDDEKEDEHHCIIRNCSNVEEYLNNLFEIIKTTNLGAFMESVLTGSNACGAEPHTPLHALRIIIPYDWEVRLFQRFVSVHILSGRNNVDEGMRATPSSELLVKNNEHKSLYTTFRGYGESKNIDFMEYIPKVLSFAEDEGLLIMWRRLRLLDYSTISSSVCYFSKSASVGDESINSSSVFAERDKIRDCSKGQNNARLNDKLFNHLVSYLIKRLSSFISDLLLPGNKHFIFGTLDDYYEDLVHIHSRGTREELELSRLSLDYDELTSLKNEMASLFDSMNTKNFELKKAVLMRFTNFNISGAVECGHDSNSDSINCHQPIGFKEDFVSNFRGDFETRFENDIYYSYPLDVIYTEKAILNLKNNHQVFREIFGERKEHKKGEDLQNSILDLTQEELFGHYMNLIDDERNQMLLLLSRLRRIKVSMNSANVSIGFKRDDECIYKIMRISKDYSDLWTSLENFSQADHENQKDKTMVKSGDLLSQFVVYKGNGEFNTKVNLLNEIVNYYSSIEVSFLLNIYKIFSKKIQINNIKLSDWFNYNLLFPCSPYFTFLEISNILNQANTSLSLLSYKYISEISSFYTEFVHKWNNLFLQVDRNFSGDRTRTRTKGNNYNHHCDNNDDRDDENINDCHNYEFGMNNNMYYDVLLLYYRGKIMRILLYDYSKNNPYYQKQVVISSEENSLFEGRDTKAALYMGLMLEREFEHRYLKVVEIYSRLKITEFLVLELYSDHVNWIFKEMTKNGLYNSPCSSNFLLHFPVSVIEHIRRMRPITLNRDVDSKEDFDFSASLMTNKEDDFEELKSLRMDLIKKNDNKHYDYSDMEINAIISAIRKKKEMANFFIRDISLLYLSRTKTVLAIRYSISGLSDTLYLSPKLLFELSVEINIGDDMLDYVFLRGTREIYHLYYLDSSLTEHFYFIESSRGAKTVHMLSHNLRLFTDKLVSQVLEERFSGGCRDNEEINERERLVDLFSLTCFDFINNKTFVTDRCIENTGEKDDFQLTFSEGGELGLEPAIFGDSIKLEKDVHNKKRFILIYDDLDLATNIILFRVYIKTILDSKCRNFNIDLAKKLTIMHYSLNDCVVDVIRGYKQVEGERCEEKNSNSFVDKKKTCLILREFSDLVKEIAMLTRYLEKLEPLDALSSFVPFLHHLWEREQMLMEDFGHLRTMSNIYLFGLNKNKQDLTSIHYAKDVFNFKRGDTFLDIFDRVVVKSEHIRKYLVNESNLDSVNKFIVFVGQKRRRLVVLESRAQELIDSIRDDVLRNKREKTYDLYGDGDVKRHMKKALVPPRISREEIRKVTCYELNKLIPNYSKIYKGYGVKPYGNYDELMSYYDESRILENGIQLVLSKLTHLESECRGCKWRHCEEEYHVSSSEKEDIQRNIKFVEEILSLRMMIHKANIISDTLCVAYLEYFKGIFRYYLVFGTRYYWGVSPPEEKSCGDDRDSLQRDSFTHNKVIFVPVLEYKVLKDLHLECQVWDKLLLNRGPLGISKYCEFVALECILSYSSYLMSSLSFCQKDHMDRRSETDGFGTYLRRNILFTNFFYLDVPKGGPLVSLMGGIVDIGEYLSECRNLLKRELVLKDGSFTTGDIDLGEKGRRSVLETGPLSVIRKRDNKLVYHFTRNRDVRIACFEFRDRREDFGPLSNIFFLKRSVDYVECQWRTFPISQPLKPNVFLFIMRRRVRQALELVSGFLYDANEYNSDLIRKKDESFIRDLNSGDKDCFNLFYIVDRYLKNALDFTFELITKSVSFKEGLDDLYLADLLSYLSPQIRHLREKWCIQKDYVSSNTKIKIDLSGILRAKQGGRHCGHFLPSNKQ